MEIEAYYYISKASNHVGFTCLSECMQSSQLFIYFIVVILNLVSSLGAVQKKITTQLFQH